MKGPMTPSVLNKSVHNRDTTLPERLLIKKDRDLDSTVPFAGRGNGPTTTTGQILHMVLFGGKYPLIYVLLNRRFHRSHRVQ